MTQDATPPVPGQVQRHLLVVEDERALRTYFEATLGAQGYHVTSVATGAAALDALRDRRIDLTLLDVGLPDMTGFEALAEFRRWTEVPVIMVTAAACLDERIRAFDLGADDYVVKPFAIEELLRRLRAVLRRTDHHRTAEQRPVTFGELVVDPAARAATYRGEAIPLTRTQFDLLRVLLTNRGRVVPFDELARVVWGYEAAIARGFIETQISRLRAQLDTRQPGLIQTVRSAGYMIGRGT